MTSPQPLLLEPSAAGIAQAVHRLMHEGLVAFPTETVYGLGANAASPAAVRKIFAAKGRPADHPVIVHIANVDALDDWAIEIPATARQLAQAFWPGPLTLVLKRAAHVPDEVTGGQSTVGLRCPAHPVAQALLRAFAASLNIEATRQPHRALRRPAGLAAPSANPFGRISPTSAAHVAADFWNTDLLILDGGECDVGIESTIIDFSRDTPVLLRPGAVTPAMIKYVIGISPAMPDTKAPRVSGALPSHYAPRKPLALATANAIAAIPASLATQTAILAFHMPAAQRFAWTRQAPRDASLYAQHLYAWLREMDVSPAAKLVIERPPRTQEWSAVTDRLNRAARR